jgi:hypothetical protein
VADALTSNRGAASVKLSNSAIVMASKRRILTERIRQSKYQRHKEHRVVVRWSFSGHSATDPFP